MLAVVFGSAWLAGAAESRAQSGEIAAYVTVVNGAGATRGLSGPEFPATHGLFRDDTSGLAIGDSLVTRVGGSAVLWFPDGRTAAYISGDSEVDIGTTQVGNAKSVTLFVGRGQVTVVQDEADNRPVVIAGGTGDKSGYTVASGASLDVSVMPEETAFTLIRGRARLGVGPVPGRIGLDQTGLPMGPGMTELFLGKTVRPGEPERVVEADVSTFGRAMNEDLFAFGVAQSAQWVAKAEQGDFTPVRPEATAATGAFGAEIGATRQAFDQPRTTITVPVGQGNLTRVQSAQINQAQNLIGSQIPSSVVVGQRIRRSRIIGNPGTTGRGQIRFNPNAEPLLLLSGRPGSR